MPGKRLLAAAATVGIAAMIVWAGWHREPEILVIPAAHLEWSGHTTPTATGVWLNSNGSCSTTLDLQLGRAIVLVAAKGQAALGKWPRVIVTINGRRVADWRIDSTHTRRYRMFVFVPAGPSRIQLRYVNDYYDPQAGEDRNVYIERLGVLQGHRVSALSRLAPADLEGALAALNLSHP